MKSSNSNRIRYNKVRHPNLVGSVDRVILADALDEQFGNFVSKTIGEFPDSTGAVVGTNGAYFKDADTWQLLEWDGSEWQEIGGSIATKGYVDDKASIIDADITVTVGSGGDYENINDAIEFLSKKYPGYKKDGFLAVINLLEGFEMDEEVHVNGIDLSWIRITGDDSETNIKRSAITTPIPVLTGGYPDEFAAFSAINGTLPVIDQLFTMDSTGTGTRRNGIFLHRRGNATIRSGAGVKNAGGVGLYLWMTCIAEAEGAVFSDSGGRNVFVRRTSLCNIRLGDITNAGTTGLRVDHTCKVHARFADFSGAGGNGVEVTHSSELDAAEIKANDCGGTALEVTNASTAYCTTSEFNNASSRGVQASRGSVIVCADSEIKNSNSRAIDCAGGSNIFATGCEIENSGSVGIWARQNSRVDARNSSIVNSSEHGVFADLCSSVLVAGGTINGHGSDNHLLYAFEGSEIISTDCTLVSSLTSTNILARRNCKINLQGSNVSGLSGEIRSTALSSVHAAGLNLSHVSGNAFSVAAGGLINALNSIGDTSVSVNTVTADGIIFK